MGFKLPLLDIARELAPLTELSRDLEPSSELSMIMDKPDWSKLEDLSEAEGKLNEGGGLDIRLSLSMFEKMEFDEDLL
jgi:hypothetical protein